MTGNFAIGWRQVWLSLILLAAGSMVTVTYGIISVPLMEEFHPSRAVLMMAMSVVAVAIAVLAPPLGTLLDKVSLRAAILVGCVLLSAGYLALSFATEFWQVLVIYGVFMAPSQLTVGAMAMTVLISRWFSAARGRAMGIALTGVSIGGIVFPLMAQFLLDHLDWRTAMRLFALLLALVTFPIAMMVINRPADVGLHPDGDDKEPEHADADAYEASGLTSKAILADPTFWILALILSVFFSAMRGVITNIAPMAMDEGIDPTLIAWLVSSYAVAGLIAKLVYAWIADRASPKLLLAIVMVGGGAAHVCLIFAEQGLPAIAAGAVLIGLTGGSLLPMQGYLVPRIFGRAVVGKVSGLLGLALFVFNVFSPPLFGLIHDLFGNYDVVYLSYAVMTVAMILLLPAMRIDPKPLTGPADEVPIIVPD